MVKQIYFEDFIDAFRKIGREEKFSYRGFMALFDFLEDNYGDDKPYELDVIALCCEFNEYESIKDYNEQYGTEYEDTSEIDVLVIDVDGTKFITPVH